MRIVRAHRLLERHLADELQMPLEAIHAAADRREHGMTPEDPAALETRLGYPAQCPHGDPIPKPDGSVTLLEAVALSEQPIGRPVVIVHVEDEPPELFRQIAADGARRPAGLTLLTAVCLMLFSVLHNPCSTTIWTIYKETGSPKWTLLGALLPLSLAFAVTFAVAQIARVLT